MEQFSGASNWKLIIRREEQEITLLRAKTCDVRAVLPETLFGLPITTLGRHALSPTALPVEGEEVEITCGRSSGEWDNKALEELTLPSALYQVDDYAFLNCRQLRTLHLHDHVQFWGGGLMMNCRSLAALHIIWDGEQGESLHHFADELSRELDVTIDGSFGRARLIFPEYTELYEENCPARHFDYNILGAGYPYHHCFRGKKLHFSEYDDLWKAYLTMDYERNTAIRLAWYRLRYPVELGEKALEAYQSYLQEHMSELLTWLVEEGTGSDLTELMRWAEPSRDELAQASALAREKEKTEALAVLLETQNKRFSRRKTFDL